jgi:hypothetical protein
MPPNEAFLSHASPDTEAASRLAEFLRGHGVPVWYSRTNILGAQQWHDAIGAALVRCDWFLLALTPAAVESTWVKRELLYALDNPRYENRIVPLLFAPCDVERLSWVLPMFQTIDFQGGFDAGCRELLRTWGISYVTRG